MAKNIPVISIPKKKLAEFCRRNYIRRLSFFGSVLTEEFGPDSDIDILVEYEPGHTPGLNLIHMQDELSSLFGGRAVDLVTSKFLNKRIRNKVIAEAVVQKSEN